MTSRSRSRVWGFAAGVVLLLGITSSPAQFGNLKPTGINAAFIKLFGAHTTFTAKADIRVLDKEGKDWARIPANVFALDEKIRLSIDMSKIESRDVPEFTLSSLKKSGMNEIVSLVRPDKKATFLIYPGAESYLNLPLPAEEARALDKGYRVESTQPAKVTLSGKERLKSQVVVKNASGAAVLAATTWAAPELKNFPVQILTKQDNMTIRLSFQDVRFSKPEAAQFEVPAGYEEYSDMQKMMVGIMKKIVAGSSKGGD